MAVPDSYSKFSDVDKSDNPNRYINFLDLITSSPNVQRYKQTTYELLNLQPGSRVLEAGCGPGDDALAMARLVAPAGQVTGLDFSQKMVDEARRRAAGQDLPVEFVQGDVTRLQFADSTFDGCRADRVLMHVPDAPLAIKELTRVLKPGGRLVAFEPDWGAVTLDLPNRELTRKILNFIADECILNGWIGRQLARLFREAGLQVDTLWARPTVFTDYRIANFIYKLDERANMMAEAGRISEAEKTEWLADLHGAIERGDFLLTSTNFMVCGVKP
jgi:ubiquinone/menaquinone biosynthesis C-methylase UbiE